MATFYRLTCDHCSKSISVAQTEAGSLRQCDCGTDLQVPRLMELKRLPVVEEQKKSVRAEWNPARGYLFAFGLILAGIGGYLHFKVEPLRTDLVTEQPVFPEIQDDIKDWPLDYTWEVWSRVRNSRLGSRATPKFLADRAEHQRLTNYLYLGWGLAAVGGLLMITSLFMSNSSRTARPSRS